MVNHKLVEEIATALVTRGTWVEHGDDAPVSAVRRTLAVDDGQGEWCVLATDATPLVICRCPFTAALHAAKVVSGELPRRTLIPAVEPGPEVEEAESFAVSRRLLRNLGML